LKIENPLRHTTFANRASLSQPIAKFGVDSNPDDQFIGPKSPTPKRVGWGGLFPFPVESQYAIDIVRERDIELISSPDPKTGELRAHPMPRPELVEQAAKILIGDKPKFTLPIGKFTGMWGRFQPSTDAVELVAFRGLKDALGSFELADEFAQNMMKALHDYLKEKYPYLFPIEKYQIRAFPWNKGLKTFTSFHMDAFHWPFVSTLYHQNESVRDLQPIFAHFAQMMEDKYDKTFQHMCAKEFAKTQSDYILENQEALYSQYLFQPKVDIYQDYPLVIFNNERLLHGAKDDTYVFINGKLEKAEPRVVRPPEARRTLSRWAFDLIENPGEDEIELLGEATSRGKYGLD
jgi:hypothetical protein